MSMTDYQTISSYHVITHKIVTSSCLNITILLSDADAEHFVESRNECDSKLQQVK